MSDSHPLVGNDKLVYRALRNNAAIDKTRLPWGATTEAFLRRDSDHLGLSLGPEPAHCFLQLSPKGITRLVVGEISAIENPANQNPLVVRQDSHTHAYIGNVPYASEDELTAERLATRLAFFAKGLPQGDFDRAKVDGERLKQSLDGKVLKLEIKS